MSEASKSLREEGLALIQSGHIADASAKLQQAVAKDSGDGTAWGLLGVCQAQLGDAAAGISSLRTAVGILPEDAPLHYNLAVILDKAGQVDAAREEVEHSLRLRPDHAGTLALRDRLATPKAPTATSPHPTASAMPAPPGNGILEDSPLYAANIPPSFLTRPVSAFAAAPAAPRSASQLRTQRGPTRPAGPGPGATLLSIGRTRVSQSQRKARSSADEKHVFFGVIVGAAYAQVWTAFRTIWLSHFGFAGHQLNEQELTTYMIVFGLAFAVVGALVGLIAALTSMRAADIGWLAIAAGLLIYGGESLYVGDTSKVTLIPYLISSCSVFLRMRWASRLQDD